MVTVKEKRLAMALLADGAEHYDALPRELRALWRAQRGESRRRWVRRARRVLRAIECLEERA